MPKADPDPSERESVTWPVAAGLALAVGGAVLATAWISDDALVTLRHVENLVAGDGFCWNILDRTLTATHPLWILLLAAVRLVTGEPYFTTMAVGIALSTIATFVLARGAGSVAAAVFVVGIGALGSRAFVEFGTCGLENPLVYALLALFLRAWLRPEGGSRLRSLGLLGALLALARQDIVLLLAPCVLMAMRGLRPRAIVAALWPGVLIGVLWYGFALVYFGTVLPTPAYGKVVSADVPGSALLVQGLRYFVDGCRRDPVTMLVICGAILGGGVWRDAKRTPLAVGVLLQVVYVLWVGGDFMSGRFFTAAFVVALFTMARHPWRRRAALGTGAILAVAAVAVGRPSWAAPVPAQAEARIEHGIGNEYSFYAWTLGLWSPQRVRPVYGSHGALFGNRDRPAVVVATTAGAYGFLGGRNVHLVEPFLCDPMLMRLPLQDPAHWRIGHFKRRIPEGYLETLASGENRIHDPDLAKYQDELQLVLRAPLFAGERWRALWGFWSGRNDALLRSYVASSYLPAPLVERDLAELQNVLGAGSHWYDVPCVVVREGGLRVRCPDGGVRRQLRLLVDGGGRGEVRFRKGGEDIGTVPLMVAEQPFAGARQVIVEVPDGARDFDAFEVRLDAVPEGGEAAVSMMPVFAVLHVEFGG
ncbi:MAG: hypothetical protein KDC98_03135 [Planctomycetes bacterium]|nr:hypothetical protein [Planctomycetota bacterium]